MKLFPQDKVDEFIADGWWTGQTWGGHFALNVERFGSQVCVVDAPNKVAFMGRDPRRLTWNQLDAVVDRCAEVFHRGGVRSGDVIGIQIPNSIELVVTYFALNRLGAILSPYAMPYLEHEISQLADIAGVSAFVTTAGFAQRDLIEQIRPVMDSRDDVHTMFAWHTGDADGVTGLDLDSFLDGEPAGSDYRAHVATLTPEPNDCVIIIFTSGTTGIPKGVPRAHGDSMVSAATNVALPRLDSTSVILNPMPMVNAGAIGGMFLPWLLSGGALVQHQPFDLEIFASQIEAEAVTYTIMPPTILNDMVTKGDMFGTHDLSSLKTVGAGSAPLSGWTIERWERDHGVEVINFFGATEGLQLSADPDTVPDPALRGRCLPRPGSTRFNWRTDVGRMSTVRLVDPSTGEEVTEPGQPGELRIKAASIFAGYLHAVEDPFDDEGYYCTGDIFEWSADEPDMLVHVDRKKDLIIRGGINISAAEVESLLMGHPRIAEVAAVGRKDDRLGERTCVFVVPRNPAEPPELDDLVRFLVDKKVAKFKLPEFLEIVDGLPRNPSGKVLKRELRMAVNSDMGSAV